MLRETSSRSIIVDREVRSSDITDVLVRHEERIQDIESGMDKLTLLTKDTNHNIAGMRNTLHLLRTITESVESIQGFIVESHKKMQADILKQESESKKQKTALDKHLEELRKERVQEQKDKVEADKEMREYITKQIGFVGSWVKWGVSIALTFLALFLSTMAGLKLLTL